MKIQEIVPLEEGIVKGIANRYIKWKERHDNLNKQKMWDDMSDSDLLAALKRAEEIMSLKYRKSLSLPKLQREAKMILRKYILPQMKKRDMPEPKVAGKVTFNGAR